MKTFITYTSNRKMFSLFFAGKIVKLKVEAQGTEINVITSTAEYTLESKFNQHISCKNIQILLLNVNEVIRNVRMTLMKKDFLTFHLMMVF